MEGGISAEGRRPGADALMRILVDSHVFAWAKCAPDQQSDEARSALIEPANDVFVSLASAWEFRSKHTRKPSKTLASFRRRCARDTSWVRIAETVCARPNPAEICNGILLALRRNRIRIDSLFTRIRTLIKTCLSN
jgi:hypothetical protein